MAHTEMGCALSYRAVFSLLTVLVQIIAISFNILFHSLWSPVLASGLRDWWFGFFFFLICWFLRLDGKSEAEN